MAAARRTRVFTSILSLGLLVAFLCLVALAALPASGQRLARAQEATAVATLRAVWHAQRMILDQGVIDVDGDGHGEPAFFAELAGAAPLRAAPTATARRR